MQIKWYYVKGQQADHMSFCEAVIILVQNILKLFFQMYAAWSTCMALVMGVENSAEVCGAISTEEK